MPLGNKGVDFGEPSTVAPCVIRKFLWSLCVRAMTLLTAIPQRVTSPLRDLKTVVLEEGDARIGVA